MSTIGGSELTGIPISYRHSVPLRPPNDVRIDCKAAKHSDGDRGALCAPL